VSESDRLPVDLELLEKLPTQLETELASAASEAAIRDAHARAVKGPIARAQAAIRQAPPSQKKAIGAALNKAKAAVEAACEARLRALTEGARAADLGRAIDVSLPGRVHTVGHLHLLTQTRRTIEGIFASLGFEIAEGPQVETDFNNFEALNIPKDHPARDAFDTFFLHDDVLLRSQTSNVQVRVMEKRKPPIRVIAPGRVYRPDTVDATHGFLFHQVEGLAVDEGVTMADLKYVLGEFARGLYGAEVRTRFRPHFFPFTEPSVEMDISCFVCGGKGCSICKRAGWIEILGAGMVDPNVFEHVGYDPERYTGFAFGMGIERIAMLKYGIDDLRLFLENDLRFLRQF
jgi:phenylalanyl-tRNA synthetase alpha chain